MAFAMADAMRTSRRRQLEATDLRLFCFPYAGGSSLIFRDWEGSLPSAVDLWPWEPPGRGVRLREEPQRAVEGLVREAVHALTPQLDRPFALYGHSMGGLLAFEIARELRRRALPGPRALLVAAANDPASMQPGPGYHTLPDEQLIERLRRFNGTPKVLFDDPELLQAYLPTLRADFEALESYAYAEEPPLDCPIVVFAGMRDRVVDSNTLEAWRCQTISEFSLEWVAGDHFFPASCRTVFLWLLSQALEKIVAGQRDGAAR